MEGWQEPEAREDCEAASPELAVQSVRPHELTASVITCAQDLYAKPNHIPAVLEEELKRPRPRRGVNKGYR